MKKIVFIAIFILTFYFLFESFNFLNLVKNKDLKPLNCDLNIQDCIYNFKGQKIKISINPKPIKSLENININIKNLNCNKNIKLKIYGLNMYMGDIIYDINKSNDYIHDGNIMLNSSLLNTTRFRTEIFEEDKYTGFYFDFDVKNNDILITKCNDNNC